MFDEQIPNCNIVCTLFQSKDPEAPAIEESLSLQEENIKLLKKSLSRGWGNQLATPEAAQEAVPMVGHKFILNLTMQRSDLLLKKCMFSAIYSGDVHTT